MKCLYSGYISATAWILPASIDTAVAVSTMMLVALGDKPVRRARNLQVPLMLLSGRLSWPDGRRLGTADPRM